MPNNLAIPLLTNEAATGSPAVLSLGGRYLWTCVGTFNGATLTLQGQGADGSTWIDAASMTSAGAVVVIAAQGEAVRVAVSGGSPSGLYSSLGRA